ncbi:MAG: hypothetical protein CL878_05260 [Dehalococcoidia bacterium]|nr:hypothetical protein [Dehalococcoidia bacterium]
MSGRQRTEPFDALCAEVVACRRCPRMEDRRRVLSPANGSLQPAVLFVAEAPGRLGADRTGTPMSSDQTGRRFRSLLRTAGIDEATIFVTNAVLCNPRDAQGRNAPPARAELASCRDYLARTLALLDPPIVVSLGVVALRQLDALSPHQLTLRASVGRPVPWSGRWLVPLYHPGPRALLHRSGAQQLTDYRRVRSFMVRVLSKRADGVAA